MDFLKKTFLHFALLSLPLLAGAQVGASRHDTLPAQDSLPAVLETEKPLIYTFSIREEIMPAVRHVSEKCLKEAREMGADLILIQLNTYGGLVDVADSLRTAILNSEIPVWAFVDNQAISAGALIAISADSLYIRPGGSIGAASVVDGSGKPLPDKFQSFMRATMRATAEAHGKVVESVRGGDTTWRWHRDPTLAEAMVGRSSGDSTTTGVLTLTADEALKSHYAEAKASSVAEVLEKGGIKDYTLYEFTPTALDRLIGWMTHPAVQGLFIMMIIGGIYFELQTPGIGFPLGVAILGALCYFAPLYLEGVAHNWELLLFVLGLILIGVEIFVLPGFGVAGVSGILCVILGLTFAAIDNDLFRYVPSGQISLARVLSPLLVVIIASTTAFVGALWFGRRFLTGRSPLRERIVLTAEMDAKAGYVGRDPYADRVGSFGVVSAVLRPSGKVLVEGTYYDAAAADGQFIDKGRPVQVVRVEGGVLYCKEVAPSEPPKKE